MDTSHKTPGLDDAGDVWDLLAERIEAFVEAWESADEPPDLARFVPAEPPEVRQLGLVELVKVDLEYRWTNRRAPRRIEEYAEAFPELAAAGHVSCDLIYEEYHVRKNSGDDVAVQEYCERFPAQADELRRLLGLEDPAATTSLFSPEKMPEVQVGDRLDDFDLLTRLGQGAFATVFLARQRSLQRLVALKVSANRGTEAQTLAQLDHPNIVRVYDQRVFPDQGQRLLYMQYVPGGTLQDAIDAARRTARSEWSGATLVASVDRQLDARGEEPPYGSATRQRLADLTWPETVCWLGMHLAEALEYAHQHGVLHRDLKPANILLSGEAVAKLVDFNISSCSKLAGANPAAYFGGSLAYMSPEQLEACHPGHSREPDSLDGRSDVYSLGVVLWELLCGRRPFGDESLEQGWSRTVDSMLERRRAGPDASMLDRLSFNIPAGLKDVLLKCLAPDPADRYPSAAELAGQLRLCRQPEAQQMLRPRPGGWRRLVWRFPVAALLAAALVPNAIAGAFNYIYNRNWIEQMPRAEEVFEPVQMAVNLTCFPLGLLITLLIAWPVARAAQRARAGDPPDEERLLAMRKRCLRLGWYAAAIGVSFWTLAGVVYPLAINLAGVALGVEEYLHFFASLVLCGLIAATYPFYGVSELSVRVMYPAMVRPGSNSREDLLGLARVQRLTWGFLVLAASLPMLGVVLLVTLGGAEDRLALSALSAVGLVGFGLIFLLARRLQQDVATLMEIISPPADALAGSISVGSSSTLVRP